MSFKKSDRQMSVMDQLVTRVNVPDYLPKIRYRDSILLIGSCFAEHIGDKLLRYKYDVLSNPFGILYNPVSMSISLDRIVRKQYYIPDELVYHDGLYHSMDHHGSFSKRNADEVIQQINDGIDLAHDHLLKSSFVCISPGTSLVYQYHPSSAIVGNCHKIPQTSFQKLQLSLEECTNAMHRIYQSIKELSPQPKFIWTISPVRHLRDGLTENQKSKACLILAMDQVVKSHEDSTYFPAYEIMLDQLRDYRYYDRDLIHPSDVAIDIIWDIFCNTYIDPGEWEFHNPLEKIKRAMAHRLLHDDPEAIKSFARNQLLLIEQLAAKLSDLNWHEERQYFFHMLEMD